MVSSCSTILCSLPIFGALSPNQLGSNGTVSLSKLKKIKMNKLAKCFRKGCQQMGQIQQVAEGGYDSNSLWRGSINPSVVLRRCGLCRKEESFMNDFKKCGKCIIIFFLLVYSSIHVLLFLFL